MDLVKQENKALEKAEDKHFSAYELKLLATYRKDLAEGKARPIPSSQIEPMYQTYLSTGSCLAVADGYPGVNKGAIVALAQELGWAERRRGHQIALMAHLDDRISESTATAVRLNGLVLDAAYKEHAPVLLRYIATGDPSEFRNSPLRVRSVKDFKEVIEMFGRLTGHDESKIKQVVEQGTKLTLTEDSEGTTVRATVTRRLSPEAAESLVKAVGAQIVSPKEKPVAGSVK